MMVLEDYYAGDEHWQRFVEVVKSNSISGEDFGAYDLTELGEFPEDSTEILNVAIAYFGYNRVIHWLNTSIAALDGKTPAECISGDRKLKDRLKEYLMRL